MQDLMRRIGAVLLAIAIAGCATNRKDVSSTDTTQIEPAPVATIPPAIEPPLQPATTVATSDNPLLQPWTGPYGGVPPFDKIRVEHFRPALEAAMAENLAEVDRIANDPAAPTFENTIAAMERTGRTLDRVGTAYGIWSSTMNSPEFQPIEREMAPKLAAFSDQITQNEKLFRRIEAVYNSPAKASLTSEQQRLAWLYHNNFVRAGAKLEPAAKQRLSAINQELAGLFTRFSQNVLADEGNQMIVIEREADLAGLPQSLRDSAASAAAAKNMTGKWSNQEVSCRLF